MAKTNTPFMSLESRGTVGGVLTSQKRGKATILREKPVPTDPYSLRQAYQRWDYKDYAYLWTLLSNAEKQIYRSRGSRYHITGFSQFMREELKALDDLLARWHLDEATGATAFDSSKNTNHATIFGATPTTGRIDRCLSFDGLNDYLGCGNDPSVLPDLVTIECFIKYDGTGTWKPLLTWKTGAERPGILLKAATRPLIYLGANNYKYFQLAPVNIYDNEVHHIAFLITGNAQDDILDAQMVADGIEQTGIPATHSAPPDSKVNLEIGRAVGYTKFHLDELKFHSRLLTQPELLRHSQRRYPLQ